MKPLFGIFFWILIALPGIAQDEDGELPESADPKVRERINAAFAAYATERLGLTTEEAQRFWPIYREFADKRRQLREQFTEAKRSGKDEGALIELNHKIKQQELDLEKDYSGRLLKVISPEKLMNLRPVERDFRRLVLEQIRQRQMQRERRELHQERQQQRIQQRNN